MTASCSDLQLWILAWEESLLPFTPISLLALLGKSQRRNRIGCLGHVLMTEPITIIEEALGSPVWITSLFHPMTREAGSICLGLGSEWVSPQENNYPCTFLLPGGVHAPAHPFFPSPSRAYGEGLETEVHHSAMLSFSKGLLSTYSVPVPPRALVFSSVQTRLDLLFKSVFVQPTIPLSTYCIPRILR